MLYFRNLWTAFNDIKFTEETHIYTDSKNTKYSFEWIKTSILGKGNKGYLIAITFTGELTAANFILDTKTAYKNEIWTLVIKFTISFTKIFGFC